MMRPPVLVFAGSDPSGGAGIQADIEAIAACGAHALPVITALTVQDNDRVHAVHPVSAELVRQQAQALIDKIAISAVKIGIVGNRANAEAIFAIVRHLAREHPELPVVLDPVLGSGHGDALAVGNAVHVIEPLIPVATLVLPNLPEAAALCNGDRRAQSQAQSLIDRGAHHVLIKGGHGSNERQVLNAWFHEHGSREWVWPRLPGAFHGSGCTLASAAAAFLAAGKSMEDSLDMAQAYCQRALSLSYPIADGQRIPGRTLALLETRGMP